MNGLVYIIILNYNNYLDTIECVYSCQKLDYNPFNIIIVDNGSTDSSLEKLQDQFPEITTISLKINNGYSAGNNVGIRYALEKNANYIWILNNDITVDANSLKQLVFHFKDKKEIGFLGSKVLNYYKPDIIDYLGGHFDIKNGNTYHVSRYKLDDQPLNDIIETDFITGCSLFLSKEIIDRVGLLNEDFFLYCEDVEWSLRARQYGYHLYVVPRSIVYHKCSSTTKKFKGLASFYITRNTLFLLENINKDNLSWLPCRLIFDAKRILSYIANQNIRGCFSLIKGYGYWLFGYMGSTTRPRKVRKCLLNL